MDDSQVQALVVWPSAPLTGRLVSEALSKLKIPIVTSLPAIRPPKLIQWSTYDELEHELTLFEKDSVLSSSYIIRKALIRKHYLSRSIRSYVTKRPESILHRSFPQTWEIELTFADELDEFWADDLYDLGANLDSNPQQWYILKPGMADRGMGIRLFNSKETLQAIFEEFEEASDDDDDDDDDDSQYNEGKLSSTAVVTSQLRHFVIQEYLMNPLLIDPSQSASASANGVTSGGALQGHKFHLRVYCVASGDLSVYMWTDILALFSSAPYTCPTEEDELADLAKHLTNTSLQTHRGEDGVRLLSELVGSQIKSGLPDRVLTKDAVAKIIDQASDVLAETFIAALASPVHFQPLPNAFELFGVDLLVTDDSITGEMAVHLLEVNAEPAIELTGPRLTWILEDLFQAIGQECVGPFIGLERQSTDSRLRKCVDVSVRGG